MLTQISVSQHPGTCGSTYAFLKQNFTWAKVLQRREMVTATATTRPAESTWRPEHGTIEEGGHTEAELVVHSGGTEPVVHDVGTELDVGVGGAELVLSDGVDFELGGGVGTELAGLEQGGDGAETKLAELVQIGEAKPELGGGHLTGLLTRPPTELLRVGEELVLAAVPRTQSSRRSCLPPLLSSIWRRP